MTTDATTTERLLRSFVERIERLDEEIKQLNNDKRDIYQEAKGSGIDVKALKQVINLRRQDPNERAELDAIVKVYLRALGMTLTINSDDTVATASSDIAGGSPLMLDEAA